MKKYKWLYLWIAAAALIVFASVVLFNAEFGRSIIFYLTGVLLIAFVIIRFVPLINTTRQKWAIVVNAIEMFVNFVVGVLMIVLTANVKDTDILYFIYPFLLGLTLYARGVIYLTEVIFLNKLIFMIIPSVILSVDSIIFSHKKQIFDNYF